MTTKRYIADTWEDALRLVKEELGSQAVILHSKQFKEGGIMGVGQRNVVEITASNDPVVVERGSQRQQAIADARGDAPPPADGSKPNYSRLLEKAYALAATRNEDGPANALQVPAPSASADDLPVVDARSSPAQGAAQGSRPAQRSAPSSDGSERLFAPARRMGGGEENQQIQSLTNDVAELKALVAKLASGSASASSGVAELSDAVKDLFQVMTEADVSPERARDIARSVSRELSGDQLDDPEAVRGKALEMIERMVSIGGPLHLENKGPSVIAMIGPTGAGKTTTLSKLAANLIINHREMKVGFVTIDTYRLGATEQLRTLANVLNVPVRVVMTPKEMEATVRELSQTLDVVFIDTAGRSQRDRMKMNELKTFLEAANPTETHLCVSATTHPSHLIASLDQFGGLKIDRLILTKLDEAATYGSVLDVLMRAQKPVSYLTVGQDIPDDIELATGARLARLLLGVDILDG